MHIYLRSTLPIALAVALMASLAACPISGKSHSEPLSASTGQTYIACGYFDFNHDIHYSSRTFAAGTVDNSSDPPSYIEAFTQAIKAQFHVAVDARHVYCDTVGAWRIAAEFSRQDRLYSGAAQPASDERLVDWPAATH